jgi:catechol 2,3-dioxygenase-like lactoylglutathione lyase family enzyme
MFQYPHHMTYVVYSIREMKEYLEKNFDMTPWRVDSHPSYGMRTLLYFVDKTIIEFVEPMMDENAQPTVDAAPCKLLSNMLRETGPGIFHVAWAVNDIDKTYADLKAKGNKMDSQGHDGPLHDSLHSFYKVFNVIPTSIGPSYANAARGVFFQCAEGAPGPEELANKGNLDINSLPPRFTGKIEWNLKRDLGNVTEG